MGIEATELEPEAETTDGGGNGNDSIVPDEKRVASKGHQREADGRRDGIHEQTDRLNHGAHVCGSLGMGILQAGNGGQNLGEGDENVRAGLGPDADLDIGALDCLAVRAKQLGTVRTKHIAAGMVAALALLVEIVLKNAGPDHGAGSNEVTGSDTLDGGEVDAELAKGGEHKGIHEGDHDDQSEGVQVGQDVVGDTAELHGGSLRNQVIVNLIVAEPEEWVPHEHSAGIEATANLINP